MDHCWPIRIGAAADPGDANLMEGGVTAVRRAIIALARSSIALALRQRPVSMAFSERTRPRVSLSRIVRNCAILLTVMEILASKLLTHIGRLAEGTPVAAKELLHLGNRAAVDQALSRLVRRGSLMRAGRGLYVRPVESRFGVRPPETAKVVQALAEHRGESVVPHGAAAANEFGLTTQVPVREVYLTSGPTRKFVLGKQVIELRHVPAWQLVMPGRPAGAAIRALAWMGHEHAGSAIQVLRRKLSGSELQAVVNVRGRLPTWLAQQVSVLAGDV